MNWETLPIKEVCLGIFDGPHATPPQSDSGGIYLGISNITENGHIDLSKPKYIADRDIPKWTKRVVPTGGDIVFSYEATLNLYAIIPDDFYGSLGRRMALIRPDLKKINRDYLFYYFFSEKWRKTIKENTINGATVDRIPIIKFPNFPITIPTLKTQNRIASILSAYDELIECNRQQIKLLEEAAQRLYKEWFEDLHFPGYENTPIVDGVPEGWTKKKLVDIVDVLYGYAFDGTLFNSNHIGMPILRIRNIPIGQTDDYTTEKADPKYIIQNGDIVVGMDGEFHINSWGGSPAYLVQRSCCFRPHNANMKGFLIQAIRGPIKFYENTVVGATVSHLGKKHIDTIEILCSPKELYEPFQSLFEKRQVLINQNQSLIEARDLLLPRLMSGEITV